MNDRSRKPQAFALLSDEAPTRTRKTREPKTIPLDRIDFESDADIGDVVPLRYEPRLIGRSFRWAGILAASVTVLLSLAAGLALTDLIDSLFSRYEILGWFGAAVLGLAVLAALAIIARETIGLLRLKRLVRIHEDANQSLLTKDPQAASRTMRALQRIYRGRPDVSWGLDALKDHARSLMAPDDIIRITERDLMASLDENALGLIARAARRVTILTAVTPAAALDILFVAALNLRMLREIATLYGGRPGTLGTLRLARMVVAHLAVTGGLALSDSLIQHVVGRGLLGRLSARFGEGAVNGILTARIGLAALDLCRPLPFLTRTKPSLAAFIRQLLSLDTASPKPALPEHPDAG
jgi:putative membrane protein